MGPIQVVVQDGNNLVLEVTPTPSTTIILDRGIAGPPGDGDVDGPASSTDNALARFDGTTGKLIQNSVGILSDAGVLAGLAAVDTTNLDATNINAFDGTASFAIANSTGVMSINDNKFTLQDNADTTKKAQFELSGLTTGTTRIYTMPNADGTFPLLGATQTFSGVNTFSGSVTMTSGSGAYNIGTTNTTGATTIGGTSGTAALTLGRSTLSQTTNIQAGATASGSTKTINFGTGGLTGSITSITIGSVGGTSTTTINGNFSANLANSTGLPISTGVSGLGTGVASALAVNTGTIGGFGNVIGPASSQNYEIPVFDGITGKLLQTSGAYINGANLTGLFSVQTNQLSIPTGSGNGITGQNPTVSGWSYTGVSKSIGTEDTAPTGLFFKPDGTKMYVLGTSGDDVNEYVLSVPWDVSTATFTPTTNNPFSVAAQDSVPADIFFKPDGLAFYIVGDTNNAVFQYTVSVPWDITTSSYASKTFSVAGQETNPSGLWFKPDGTEMYVVGSATDTVYKYTLSTAWDVSTASYASVSFSVASQESSPSGLVFTADGLRMYVLGSTGDDINQWNLSTAWDITSATFDSKFYVGFQETVPSALYFDFTLSSAVYVVGSTTDTVFQYEGPSSIAIKENNQNLLLNGYTRINNNAYIDGSLKLDGSVTIDGSITAVSNLIANQISTSSSAITLGSTVTTGTTSITVTQSSGAINIGGTAGTGAITLGQSTAAQTLNLATGATATATTKTVNIGTAGVSGSTTNINYGSVVAGSLGTHIWGIGGEQMRLTTTGLGIGTSSPTVKLEVGNGSGLQQALISGGGYNLILGASGGSIFGFASQAISTVFNTSSVPLGVGTSASQPLIFGTANTERARIDATGNLIQSAPTTPPTLATNGQMVFNLTSNTNLRVSVRGSDGVTRTANITLA